MTTLILRSQGTLLAPAEGTPKIPDTTTGLIYTLNAADVMQADGSAVPVWVASGPAPLVNRTYNFLYSGWSAPTLSLTGAPQNKPAIMFNGSQQIWNNAGTSAVAQPVTYAMVVKSTAFASSQARVFASGSQIVAPGNNGYYASVSAGSRLESGSNTADWTVVVVVFDGLTSKIKVGNGPINTGNTGTAATARNGFGGQGTALTGVGLQGGVAKFVAYARALNDSDINAISLILSREYGL